MTVSDGWVLAGDRILWTNTAGQSWVDISPPFAAEQSISAVYFLDTDHGWAVLHAVDSASPTAISVAATSDRGRSWSTQALPASKFVLEAYVGASLSFADGMHGLMLVEMAGSSASSSAELFSTSDGGREWSELPKPPVAGSIQSLSEGTAWLVGGIGNGELYRTQDGGQTWAQKEVALPAGVAPYAEPKYGPGFVARPVYSEPTFKTNQRGLLAVTLAVRLAGTDLLLYSTEDGGSTWQFQSLEADLTSVGALATFDSTVVQASAVGGAIVLRQGQTTTSAPLPAGLSTRLSVSRAELLDGDHGWLLLSGARGETALVGTDDGGKTIMLLLNSAGEAAPRRPAPRAGGRVVPQIGGVTTVLYADGIDSCQPIPPEYVNSVYGSYSPSYLTAPTVYGFYLPGGETYPSGCYQANNAWVSETACAGWQYLPIWDGLQAPCNTGASNRISTTLATAASQGQADGASAASALASVGLSPSIAYLDIEQYPTGNSACSQSVEAYVNGFVQAMHSSAYGFNYAGVYVSGQNATDMLSDPPILVSVPDDVWVPNYNGQAVTTPLSGVPNTAWVNNQRAHQYYGGSTPPFTAQHLIKGNTTYSWDLDIVDATVAEMINPPANCSEGCKAACYNGTAGWCGSICLNCDDCTCENGRCTGCPIVLDPVGQGFHLTSLQDGVKFALKANQPVQVSWTDPAYKNAWLVLDRNGNGIIDDFTELFGDLTPQPPGPDPNGYKALAVFDDPQNGGNGNGRIDSGDAVYSQLRLWVDRNHNGFSEPDELIPLAEAGIFSIDLHYRQSVYTDRYGNQFRYFSEVADAHGRDDPRCYDVWLLVEPVAGDNEPTARLR